MGEKACERNVIFEEAIYNVLKDMELIYHNCILYNANGSTYTKMSIVQRTKFHELIHDTILPLLSSNSIVTEKYTLLLNNIEQERTLLLSSSEKQKKQSKNKDLNTEHIIEVPRNMGGTSRIIAIVDIQNHTVIKRYTTLKAASLAAMYINKILGYKPE